MYRRGIVEAVDAATVRVRVRFPDADNMVSWWLEVLQPRTLGDRSYWMPEAGEAVAVLMDERDEAGLVLGSIYSTTDPPPVASADKRHTVHKDGAVFEYDRATHTVTVAIPAGGRIVMSVGDGTSLVMDDAGARLVGRRLDLN